MTICKWCRRPEAEHRATLMNNVVRGMSHVLIGCDIEGVEFEPDDSHEGKLIAAVLEIGGIARKHLPMEPIEGPDSEKLDASLHRMELALIEIHEAEKGGRLK